MIDLLENKTVCTDLCTSLVITQWLRLGLQDVDFIRRRETIARGSFNKCYLLRVFTNSWKCQCS